MNVKALPFEPALRESRAFKLLKKDFDCSNVSHAYMVVSDDEEGVKEFLMLSAALLFCKNGSACLHCANCERLFDSNLPDCHQFNTEGASVKVQQVNQLIGETQTRPFEQDKQVFLINRADLMTREAQNKLLKTLEEPPADTYIFLGVCNSSAIVETVKSRCRKITLDKFSPSIIEKCLVKTGVESEQAKLCATCSEGSLSKAVKLSQKGNFSLQYGLALELLKGLKKSSDVATYMSNPTAIDNLSDFLDVLSVLLRDIMVLSNGETQIFSSHLKTELQLLQACYSTPVLANVIELIVDAKKRLSLNVNAVTVFEHLLFGILEVKYKCR